MDDLAEFANQVMMAQLGTLSGSGAWTSDGSGPIVIPCYIEGEVKLVRDLNGREIISNIQVITLEDNSLNAKYYRFNLPARYTPNFEVPALNVIVNFDENNNGYEEVEFA